MSSIRDKLEGKQTKLARIKEAESLVATNDYRDGSFYNVDIDLLRPDPDQPRKYFDPDLLAELCQSIQQKGILQPVLVRIDDEKNIWIVAGERRYRAAKMAGLTQVPAIISTGNPSEIALIENIQREDLKPIEEAEALDRVVKAYNYTHEQLALIVGKARSTITETLSLNRLPEEIKDECRRADKYPRRFLVEIAKQENAQTMHSLFDRVKDKELTSDDLRKITRIPAERKPNAPSAIIVRKTRSLAKSLTKLNFAAITDDDRLNLIQELDHLRQALENFLN